MYDLAVNERNVEGAIAAMGQVQAELRQQMVGEDGASAAAGRRGRRRGQVELEAAGAIITVAQAALAIRAGPSGGGGAAPAAPPQRPKKQRPRRAGEVRRAEVEPAPMAVDEAEEPAEAGVAEAMVALAVEPAAAAAAGGGSASPAPLCDEAAVEEEQDDDNSEWSFDGFEVVLDGTDEDRATDEGDWSGPSDDEAAGP